MKDNTDHEIDLADELPALSSDEEILFLRICSFASTDQKNLYNKLGSSFYQYEGEKESFPTLWDGRILYEYLEPSSEELSQFKKIISRNGISYENVFKRMPTRFIAYESVQKSFIASARAKGI